MAPAPGGTKISVAGDGDAPQPRTESSNMF
jgi:hypothetical protein